MPFISHEITHNKHPPAKTTLLCVFAGKIVILYFLSNFKKLHVISCEITGLFV